MHTSLLPFILLSLGLAAVNANPVLSPFTLHERRSSVPPGWEIARKHDASAVIPLRFALAQNNIEIIEDYLYDVSHPNSPNYGKHWSAGQVAKTFTPSGETIDAVRNWLVESGIEPHRIELSASRGWLEVTATVQEAEELLHTTYNVYEHETGAEHVGCGSYDLPEHLVPHIDFVTPTVHFDAKISKRSGGSRPPLSVGLPSSGNGVITARQATNGSNELADCDKQITPSCLRALYGLNYEPQSQNNSFGIVEYTPSSYSQSDLDLFARRFSTDLVGVSPIMNSIDGGVLSTQQNFDNHIVPSLDLQYAMNLVTSKQPVSLYQVGDPIIGGSYNNFLDAIDGSYCTFEGGDDPTVDSVYPDHQQGGFNGPTACGTVKPANVISIGYTYSEADVTPFYAQRQCAEYGKLGLMGITILYSSGDFGVAGYGNNCLNPNGTQSTDGKIFNPIFPPSCPYVTSVGATQVSPGKTATDGEDACETYMYSGGGFSNYFAMPEYQKDAVGSYLKNYPPQYPSDIWNSTGTSRAFPDLSANGPNFVTAIYGNFTLIYGTAGSSSVVGAILTMVNDARITAGKSPIGFINPLIYSANFTDAFNDITNGTNQGCGTLGFSATKGWDPVTGLGTPKFQTLVEKWLALP